MKRLKLKKSNNKLTLIIISIFLILFFTIIVFRIINLKASPIIFDYASLEAKKLSSIIINKAISKHATERIDSEKLFDITKDDSGEIKSIDFNAAIVNRFLTETTNSIQMNLKNIENGNIDELEFKDVIQNHDKNKLSKGIIYEVRTGVLIGNPLLANVGPKVPVKINLLGDAVSSVSTKVTNYGINNALIEVFVHIKITEKVILPFYNKPITIESKVPVALKIVTGTVPKYYGGSLTQNSPSLSFPFEEIK